MLNSSTYAEGAWTPDTAPGDLSWGNFSTAVTTRSLSIFRNSTYRLPLTLVYYEDPKERISVLSQQPSRFADDADSEWVDMTSQESKSLPDDFRNNPASVAEGYSKTLYESLRTNTTLRAPFTCGETWSSSVGTFLVGAIFYSPQLSSPNASNFQFVIEGYTMGPGGSPGNFTNENLDNTSTKPPIPHSCLHANIYYSF